VTFADRYTLEVAGERVELARHGSNHSPDNVYIHFPDHDTLMLIDIVNAGWVLRQLGRLATRDDVAVHQQYIADIEASAKEALASVDPLRLDYGPSGPVHP